MDESEFWSWWLNKTSDGIIPARFFSEILHNVFESYKKYNYSFIYREEKLIIKIAKYIFLLFIVSREGSRKQIIGPNIRIQYPQKWTADDEQEWIAAYESRFDSQYWEYLFGRERGWEHAIYRWRYELPSILQSYTSRNRDNLPGSQDDDDYYHNDFADGVAD